MKFKGFTLAEILITLAIIGIVAALTIPSVISNYQQQEFKTGLKKAVSVLNEAIQTNIAQEGETPYENANLMSYLQRHMNILKTGRLWAKRLKSHDGGFGSNEVFYTTDGMRFELRYYSEEPELILHESGEKVRKNNTEYNGSYCGSYGLYTNTKTKNPPCVITVDVNGDKKPNTPIGEISAGIQSTTNSTGTNGYTYSSPSDKKLQDVFNILITEDRAIPFGVVAQRAMYSK